MGRLSLTCFEAPRDTVLPILEDYYDWLRAPRLVGVAPSLEEAANAPRFGSVAIFGERAGRTYVFDRDLEPRDLGSVVAISGRIGGAVVTGYHESITGNSALVAARAGKLLRKIVVDPEAPVAEEGSPLASEAESPLADGDFDAIVNAAECLGFEWASWEGAGPFELYSDELPKEEEEEIEVLQIDPNAPRPGIWQVLSWLGKHRPPR